MKQMVLLYLLTETPFWIGQECVMCHGSKLSKSLGKQQLELSTHT